MSRTPKLVHRPVPRPTYATRAIAADNDVNRAPDWFPACLRQPTPRMTQLWPAMRDGLSGLCCLWDVLAGTERAALSLCLLLVAASSVFHIVIPSTVGGIVDSVMGQPAGSGSQLASDAATSAALLFVAGGVVLCLWRVALGVLAERWTCRVQARLLQSTLAHLQAAHAATPSGPQVSAAVERVPPPAAGRTVVADPEHLPRRGGRESEGGASTTSHAWGESTINPGSGDGLGAGAGVGAGGHTTDMLVSANTRGRSTRPTTGAAGESASVIPRPEDDPASQQAVEWATQVDLARRLLVGAVGEAPHATILVAGAAGMALGQATEPVCIALLFGALLQGVLLLARTAATLRGTTEAAQMVRVERQLFHDLAAMHGCDHARGQAAAASLVHDGTARRSLGTRLVLVSGAVLLLQWLGAVLLIVFTAGHTVGMVQRGQLTPGAGVSALLSSLQCLAAVGWLRTPWSQLARAPRPLTRLRGRLVAARLPPKLPTGASRSAPAADRRGSFFDVDDETGSDSEHSDRDVDGAGPSSKANPSLQLRPEDAAVVLDHVQLVAGWPLLVVDAADLSSTAQEASTHGTTPLVPPPIPAVPPVLPTGTVRSLPVSDAEVKAAPYGDGEGTGGSDDDDRPSALPAEVDETGTTRLPRTSLPPAGHGTSGREAGAVQVQSGGWVTQPTKLRFPAFTTTVVVGCDEDCDLLRDMLLGIVPPAQGDVSVGTKPLATTTASWRVANLGFVSSTPTVLAANVLANVTLGAPASIASILGEQAGLARRGGSSTGAGHGLRRGKGTTRSSSPDFISPDEDSGDSSSDPDEEYGHRPPGPDAMHSFGEAGGRSTVPQARDIRRIMAAVRAADLHGLVAGLPNGFDTVLGPAGVDMEAPQRLRFGLARVSFAGHPVCVVDAFRGCYRNDAACVGSGGAGPARRPTDGAAEVWAHSQGAIASVLAGRTGVVLARTLANAEPWRVQGYRLVVVSRCACDGGVRVAEGPGGAAVGPARTRVHPSSSRHFRQPASVYWNAGQRRTTTRAGTNDGEAASTALHPGLAPSVGPGASPSTSARDPGRGQVSQLSVLGMLEVEVGTHRQLMLLDGHYAALVRARQYA